MFSKDMTVGIGCDHAGFELKEYLKETLGKEGFVFKDFGTNGPESVDYPDFAHAVAQEVQDGRLPFGILICGSGVGISISANKHPHVRCALCWMREIAKLSRQHNDANILAMPGRFISKEEALETVRAFFSTGFEGGRHQRRIDKIDL
ncbi:MAG: ribose 5-phosphate isomerase B [Bacteroides sp.]|nr:ribose 5-phosphate isomerase B [Bacteroides sp.]MCM1085557.1 ribose 5-phosphate isomerase B [Bacteroides sp.]